jgi:hypothetical protein
MDLTLVGENTTTMSSTPTKQMNPTPVPLLQTWQKHNLTTLFVVNLFHFDTIKSKGPTMQTNVMMNVKMRGSKNICYKKCCPLLHKKTHCVALYLEEEYEMLEMEAHFDVPIFGNMPSFQCKFYKLCSKTIIDYLIT